MSVDISDFAHDSCSACCGVTLYNYNDGFGICGECKEWSESEVDGKQRVAPSALMSVMVKAVQELSKQVDELKAEIITLKGE